MRYFRQIFRIGDVVIAVSVFLYVNRTVIVNVPPGAIAGIVAGALRVIGDVPIEKLSVLLYAPALHTTAAAIRVVPTTGGVRGSAQLMVMLPVNGLPVPATIAKRSGSVPLLVIVNVLLTVLMFPLVPIDGTGTGETLANAHGAVAWSCTYFRWTSLQPFVSVTVMRT